jgi:hypothetical protein
MRVFIESRGNCVVSMEAFAMQRRETYSTKRREDTAHRRSNFCPIPLDPSPLSILCPSWIIFCHISSLVYISIGVGIGRHDDGPGLRWDLQENAVPQRSSDKVIGAFTSIDKAISCSMKPPRYGSLASCKVGTKWSTAQTELCGVADLGTNVHGTFLTGAQR